MTAPITINGKEGFTIANEPPYGTDLNPVILKDGVPYKAEKTIFPQGYSNEAREMLFWWSGGPEPVDEDNEEEEEE